MDVMLSSWLLPVSSMVVAVTFVRSSSTSPAESACLVCSSGSIALIFTSFSSPGGAFSVVLVEPYCGMVVEDGLLLWLAPKPFVQEGGGLGFRAPGFRRSSAPHLLMGPRQTGLWFSFLWSTGERLPGGIVPVYTYAYKKISQDIL